ncbi:MAG: MBL fold metallo-hydrolase [Oscillospiraceae bacterium]|jgi:phosphoribosyl 1,2-cyclic phosphodiesterase|nr:MBL fold metallo-hydrolase [Oscillospiraceae bacterium]
MEIKAFASGSTGNSYYISDGETALLLECGITIRQLEIALKFNLSRICGCLVTHEHLDHSKCADKLTAQGVDVYASAGTLKAINLTSHRTHTVTALKQFINLSRQTILKESLKYYLRILKNKQNKASHLLI